MASFVYYTTCICLVFSNVVGVRFYVEPTLFYAEDANVTLICESIGHSTRQITDVTRIAIEKLGEFDIWTDVAVIESSFTEVQVLSPNISAVGRTGDVSTANLIITWPVATIDKFGRYRCEASGYTAKHDLTLDKSVTLDLRGVPDDNSRQLYEYLSRSDKNLLRNIESSLFKVLGEQLQVTRETFTSGDQYSIPLFASKISEKIRELDVITIDKIVQNNPLYLLWPEGNFTLLMPDTHCPENPATWQWGYLQQKTLQSTNGHSPLPGLHMALPSYEGNFMFQHFCTLRVSASRQKEWPAGSYCINQHGESCPNGFNSTQLKYDLDDDGSNKVFGLVPDGNFDNPGWRHILNYCCRHDGDPRNPIPLPWSKPFYLYRHGGVCQNVKNMDMISDGFILSTDSDDSGDSWNDGIGDPEYRPDIEIRPIRAHLCYYKMRRA